MSWHMVEKGKLVHTLSAVASYRFFPLNHLYAEYALSEVLAAPHVIVHETNAMNGYLVT